MVKGFGGLLPSDLFKTGCISVDFIVADENQPLSRSTLFSWIMFQASVVFVKERNVSALRLHEHQKALSRYTGFCCHRPLLVAIHKYRWTLIQPVSAKPSTSPGK